MILIDLNQVMISNLMMQIGNHKNTKIEENLVRHMVLNSIRAANVKFKSEFGEIVICCDDKNYWRKDIYPYYKASRKKDRDTSELDWNAIFHALNNIRDELKEYFHYRVLHVEHAEADDIIATLCYRFGGDGSEPILILSGDKDFQQLQSRSNVTQYDPVRKTFLKCKSPKNFLWEHIIRGDRGDGIPNVRSPDACLVEGVRQKPIKEVKLSEWLDNLTLANGNPEAVFDEEQLKNWKRNESLIDLRKIPDEVMVNIMEQFDQQKGKSKIKLQNYFIKYRLKQLMAHYSEF